MKPATRRGLAVFVVFVAGIILFRRRSVAAPDHDGEWHPVDA